MKTSDVQQLKTLVSEGNIEKVIATFTQTDNPLVKEYETTANFFSGQLNNLKIDRQKNLIAEGVYQRERGRIMNAVLEILADIQNRLNIEKEKEQYIFIELASTEESFQELLKKRLGPNYIFESTLSKGEDKYAIIYKVQKKLNRKSAPRALKVFKTLSLIDEENNRLMQKDLEAISQITESNPCLVRVEYEKRFLNLPPRFILSDFVHGENLEDLLGVRSFSLDEIKEILLPLFQAVDQFHRVSRAEEGEEFLVHANLRPSNILIQEDGFGLEPRLFPPKIINGIFYKKICSKLVEYFKYWSPEQIDRDLATPKSDQYSLGLITFELITGYPLFKGVNILEIIKRRIEIQKNPSIIQKELLAADCPADLIAIVERMLQNDPGIRFDNLVEVHNALKKVTPKKQTL